MPKSPGFSLVEMLIVLSIIAIVLAMSFISQKFFVQSSTVKMIGAELLHAIQITRNEAVMQNKSAFLCKSADQQTCSGEWRNGYIIKVNEKIFHAAHFKILNGTIYWRAFPLHREDLEFLPTGFSKVENGTFWLCLQGQSNPAWAIILNQTGRVRMVYPDQDGRIYDSRQDPISCQ